MLNPKNIYLFILLLLIVQSDGDLYKRKEKDVAQKDLKSLENPFQMAKLNVAWVRAQKTLNDSALKSFYREMKTQDKELVEWKLSEHMHAASREGLRQAQLMYELIMLMDKYDLLNYMEGTKNEVPVKRSKRPEKV